MLSQALRDKDFAAIADWFTLLFLWVGLGSIVAAGLAAGIDLKSAAAGFRVLALSSVLAGACGICGWVFGLLFGVPRTLARPGTAIPSDDQKANEPGKAASTSRVNTNLEDISDWLTKTIVGVGLTQLYAAPGALWKVAGLLDEKGMGWAGHGPLLVLSIILYFFPGGFWIGYVTTRTILTGLFSIFSTGEMLEPEKVAKSADISQLRIDRASGKFVSPTAEVAVTDRSLLKVPLQDLKTEAQLAGWAAAKARSNDLSTAATIFRQLSERDPQNTKMKEQLAKVQIALGQKTEAGRTLSEVPPSEVNVLQALYDPPPEGYTRAIDIASRLLQQPDMERKSNLHVYLACAYGQKHADTLKSTPDDAAGLSALVDKVVEQVRRALQIDPNSKSWIRSLWKPAPGGRAIDNDLESIPKDNAEMAKLLDG